MSSQPVFSPVPEHGARLALYTHETCLQHDPGAGHPENRRRLDRVLETMQLHFPPDSSCDHGVEWVSAPEGTKDQVLLAHDQSYWDLLSLKTSSLHEEATPVNIDEDTRINKYSLKAALYGVGAVCQAVDDVCSGKYRRGFCLVRPPGHHAQKKSSMGFCLFGNAAIGARYALTQKGVNRVAIIDFDVHQGNGTEDLVRDRPDILFVSIHQDKTWPYLHHENHGDHGTIYNYAVPAKSSPSVYHSLFDTEILPKLESWHPDLVIISAGFDAHRDDPPPEETLFNDPPGRQLLLEADFDLMTCKLVDSADRLCGGRIISCLEGGYNPGILARCCVSHGQALAGIKSGSTG